MNGLNAQQRQSYAPRKYACGARAMRLMNMLFERLPKPLFFLWLDAFLALRQEGVWRIGVIGALMFLNVALLTGYSLSCHSFRHVIGGKMDCFSCSRGALLRYRAWERATWLNIHHLRWAWASLISVAVTDLLIRLLAIGVIGDPALRF